MAKKGYEAEAQFKKMLEQDGWLVFRVSGSIGAGDLIAMRAFRNKIYQIKSTINDVFYFDKNSRDEIERLFDIEAEYGIPCYLAIQFRQGKGKKNEWVVKRVGDIDFRPIRKP